MPNKKYIDYPPGTYDTSKIFLQADPVTGALQRINLPTIISTQSHQTLKIFLGPFLSIAGTTATIATFNLPANTLLNNGDRLKMEVFYKTTGTDTKTVVMKLNNANMLNFASNTAAEYRGTWDLMKANNSEQYGRSELFRSLSQSGLSQQKTTGFMFDTDQTFVVQITSVNAGSIEIQRITLDLYKKEI
jgi:hypothetical protein